MNYQIMPELSEEEYQALKENIRQNGVEVALIYDEAGNLLDGYHRLRACQELGIEDFPKEIKEGLKTDNDRHAFARRINMLRRHLNQAQKRELIKEQLKETPEISDNQIAGMLGVSQPTVGAVRKEMEGAGELIKFISSIGADGKVRKRRKSKPKEKAKEQEVESAIESKEDGGDDIGEEEKDEPELYRNLPPEKPKISGKATFNATTDKIEWAKWTWNPVTGCLHGCEYCYARDIANRFYDEGFKPTWHPDRLVAPHNTKIPEARKNESGIKNVFVCSMADLFGDWVKQEHIERILEVVRDTPNWNYIFLTKNPSRLIDFDWPVNTWVGATVDIKERLEPTLTVFRDMEYKEIATEWRKPTTFISFEPLLESMDFAVLNKELSSYDYHGGSEELAFLSWVDWVIIGGRSRSSQCSAFQPEWLWVEEILWEARKAKARIYFKPNLTVVPKEYPDIGGNIDE